jgi:hypothetical protein
MSETDDDRSDGFDLLTGLPTSEAPPAFLEERIVARLRDAKMIRASSLGRFRGYPALITAIALSLVTFFVGAFIGTRRSVAAASVQPAGYLLIVRAANAQFEPKSPQEELLRVKEYSAWARDLGQQGLMFGGEKLKDEVNVLSPAGDGLKVNENRANLSEGDVAGYFLLPSSDYDQALSIARTCPHLKHGGAVELRQIERF